MSNHTSSSTSSVVSAEVEELQLEIQQLRAENKKLKSSGAQENHELLLSRWKLHAEDSNDIMLLFDENLRITYCNRAAKLLLLAQFANCKQSVENGLRLFFNHSWDNFRAKVEIVGRGEAPLETFKYINADTATTYDFVVVAPFHEGNPGKVFIAGQKALAVEYDSDASNTVIRQLNNLLHSVAHDLRSPVVNIRMLLNFYRKLSDEAEKENFLMRIEQSVGKMDNVLTGLFDILNLYDAEEDGIELVNIQDVITKVKGALQQEIVEKEANVIINSQVNSFRYIHQFLYSAIFAAISNSLKYHQEGVPPHIELTIEQLNEALRIKIKDNGHGIDLEKNSNAMFKPFKRFSANLEGKGVGLFMIKTIAEKNGGNISIESKPGIGTTLDIYLKPY